jgi:asparaginyl-tRNA synthetase
MERTLIRDVLQTVELGQTVAFGGWVRTVRHSNGGFSFISLNDGSCFALLQVVADGELANYDAEIQPLTAGACLLVTGTVVESQGKGQSREVHASDIRVLGSADAESYPMQAKRHSFEFLRTQAHLRTRSNTFGAVARVRNRICYAIHEFFQQRSFLYVHTPIITASDCEGAGEQFTVTTFDLADPPRTDDGQVDFEADFFARHTYLTVSGQLEVEPYCCSLGDVYTFGPTFRAENSNTPRHLAEFWMVEPEMAFCDLARDADIAEAFIRHVAQAVLTDCAEDLNFFVQRIEKTVADTLRHVVETDFIRLPYTEAIDLLDQAGRTWEYPVAWGQDLQTEHERYLAEEKFRQPVILTDYPRSIKPFYMYCNDDGKTVRAMDVLVPNIGEIIGGSQREHRLDVLEARMAECGLDPAEYWWYLDTRRYGSVPHAGFGLGLERCVQFCTGMANIRDVIPYPRTPRHAEF